MVAWQPGTEQPSRLPPELAKPHQYPFRAASACYRCRRSAAPERPPPEAGLDKYQ